MAELYVMPTVTLSESGRVGNALQESAKYAHSLFDGTVSLYGKPLRVKYSPQGAPGAVMQPLSQPSQHAPLTAGCGRR